MRVCGAAGIRAVAGLVLLAGLTACGIHQAATPACTLPSAPAAPDPVELKIVDQGFSVVGPEPASLSMGVVVENNGTRVAYRTRVAFAPVDAHGRDPVPAAERQPLVQEVPIILPGERAAVGTSVPLSGPGTAGGRTGRVARLTVRADATSRLDPAPFDTLSARVIGSRSYRYDDGSTTVDYEAHSGYCDDLYPRGASVVFRNANGAIVGGDLINVTESGCETGTKVVEVRTAAKSVPQKADLNRTELTPYCDLARAPVSGVPGAPAN